MEKLTRIVPTISTAEIEENAHDAFKRYRASYPIATLEAGGYIVLRHADVTRLDSVREGGVISGAHRVEIAVEICCGIRHVPGGHRARRIRWSCKAST